MFGPYQSREEWLEKTHQLNIDLKECGPRYASPFGALLSHKADCGCEKSLSMNGEENHEIFTPCSKHSADLPAFDVKNDLTKKPDWEERMLKRKGKEVQLEDLQPGDTVHFGDDHYPLLISKVKADGD